MTMLLVLVTAGAVFVAGDSRQFPTHEDTRQKVQLAGRDAITAEAGIGVIPDGNPQGGPWDALAVLQDIAVSVPDGTFSEQLNFLREKFNASFSDAAARFHNEIPLNPAPKIDVFFVKRDTRGRAYVAVQEFHVRSIALPGGRWQHRVEIDAPQIELEGVILQGAAIRTYWSVPNECTVDVKSIPTNPQGHEAQWMSDLIRVVAAQSPQCAAQIGGPIRIATIDAAGAHWLSK